MASPFAFVFPGQGSQSVGMLGDVEALPVVARTLGEAADILGAELLRVLREGPADALNLTENTQPLMLTASVALFRLWLEQGGAEPAWVAGHSLGEYSALVASGALAFEDALPLVRFRARAMQEAAPAGSGAMAAVLGLDDDTVRAECARIAAAGGPRELVQAVNFNAPMQVVIAGAKAGVEKAAEALKARGAKRVLPLPVSAPFHSALMRPAAERLAEYLNHVTIRTPRIPLVNNVDVAVETEPQAIRDALVRQADHPVRWVECVQELKAHGARALIECGPGKVLAGLTKRIEPELPCAALYDRASLGEVQTMLAGL